MFDCYLHAPALLAAIEPHPTVNPDRTIYPVLAIVALVLAFRIWRDRRSPKKMLITLLAAMGTVCAIIATLFMKGSSQEARLAVAGIGAVFVIGAFGLRLWSYRQSNRRLLIYLVTFIVLFPLFFFVHITMRRAGSPPAAMAGIMALELLTTFVIFIGITLWLQRRTQENLKQLADRLGWQIEVKPRYFRLARVFFLMGHHRGREVRFVGFTPANTRIKRKWVGVVATLKDTTNPNMHVVLSPKIGSSATPGNSAAEAGLSVGTLGDADFDRAFLVRAKDPSLIHYLFTLEIRRKLLELRKQKFVAFIVGVNKGKVVCSTPGTFANAALIERLAENIDLVCDLADAAEKIRT